MPDPVTPPRDGLVIAERRPVATLQLAVWPETAAKTATQVRERLGIELPSAPGTSNMSDRLSVLCVAPGRYLILAIAPLPLLELDPADAAVSDLSDARYGLRLEGTRVRELLAKLVPIDVAPQRFAVGAVAQTLCHHMTVLLHRVGDARYDLFAPASFGLSFREWVERAAAEFEPHRADPVI